MNKKYTFKEYGEMILKELEEKINDSQMVEYASVCKWSDTNLINEKIVNLDFDLSFKLKPGNNEGIYLDIYLNKYIETKDSYDTKTGLFITIKTLKETDEAMIKMATLCGHLIVIAKNIKWKMRKYFEREKVIVTFKDELNSPFYVYYEYNTIQDALNGFEGINQEYPNKYYQIIDRDSLKIIKEGKVE